MNTEIDLKTRITLSGKPENMSPKGRLDVSNLLLRELVDQYKKLEDRYEESQDKCEKLEKILESAQDHIGDYVYTCAQCEKYIGISEYISCFGSCESYYCDDCYKNNMVFIHQIDTKTFLCEKCAVDCSLY